MFGRLFLFGTPFVIIPVNRLTAQRSYNVEVLQRKWSYSANDAVIKLN